MDLRLRFITSHQHPGVFNCERNLCSLSARADAGGAIDFFCFMLIETPLWSARHPKVYYAWRHTLFFKLSQENFDKYRTEKV